MNRGLILKKPDIRRYKHERKFGTVAVPTEGLGRKPLAVYDQQETNFCTGFSAAGAMSFKLGFPVSPEYMVAKEGEVNGKPILDGADMDLAPAALSIFGALPQKDCPYSLAIDGPEKIAQYSNYPSMLDDKAKPYIQGAYYTAHEGSSDAFTNIITAIYQAHLSGEEVAVQMGTSWYREFNLAAEQKLPMPLPRSRPVSEHAWVIFDWKDDKAYALLSQGESFGFGGVLEFPREVVNFLFTDAWATTRVERDEGIGVGLNKAWLLKLLFIAIYNLKKLIGL